MTKSRLEAFSDGVIAIIITIMVLELKVPETTGWSGLADSWRGLLGYLLSFVFLGVYWNNHHHLLHLTERVTGSILWANLHLLFWLSLVPFGTAWLSEHEHLEAVPVATYGIVLLCAGVAFNILQRRIIADQGAKSRLLQAIGADWKGKSSLLLYLVAIPLSVVSPLAAVGVYALVMLMWLVPDRRIEAVLDR